MTPILGIWASQISGHLWAPTGAYDALATVTVPSGGAASVMFAGIPTGYKHLQIRAIARSNRSVETSDPLKITFNSDTASNYSQHYLTGAGSGTPTAEGYANQTFVSAYVGTAAGASASVFGASVVDILDYADTSKYKTTRALGGFDNNGSGFISLVSGNWRSSNAINSITIAPQVGTLWNQYSSFALYGIK